jgi:PEP-CTERM motif
MSLPNEGRRLVRFLMLAFVTAALSSVVAHANIIYPVNTTITSSNPTGNPLQSNTVSGFITTDGTIGVIGTSNILSWNLNLIDGLNAANDFDLTPADSTVVEDTGSALSATLTGLSFNFSGTGEFLIQANTPGPFSGYSYFCFSTGSACLAGETISPQFITVDGVVATGAAEPIGSQPLAPPSGSVPEPSSYGLMIMGMLGAGAVLKRRFLA